MVERALLMAYSLRGEVPDGLFLIGRGTQFTSAQLRHVSQQLGLAKSVGRSDVCINNSMTRSCWSTLETEYYDRKERRPRDDARKAEARWIEIVHNRCRCHSSLRMTGPVDFETQIIDQKDKEQITA